MRFSSKFICALSIVALLFEAKAFVYAAPVTPQVPETSDVHADVPAAVPAPLPDPQQLVSELTQGNDYPVELIIPSIKLDGVVVALREFTDELLWVRKWCRYCGRDVGVDVGCFRYLRC